MPEKHGGSGSPVTAPEGSEPVSLRDAWLRVRAARRELGSAEAVFEEARARSAIARALAEATDPAARKDRAPPLEELEWLEPLLNEMAERIFLGTSLREAAGLEAEAEALRQRMGAGGAAAADIDQAVLALARDRVLGDAAPGATVAFPLEHREWLGEEYALGIGGQRVAVMGFSHGASRRTSTRVSRRMWCRRSARAGAMPSSTTSSNTSVSTAGPRSGTA